MRPRSHVICDLAHATAFVGPSGKIQQYDHRLRINAVAWARKIFRADVGGRAAGSAGVETVRNATNRHSASVPIDGCAWIVELVNLVDAMLGDALIERRSYRAQRSCGRRQLLTS